MWIVRVKDWLENLYKSYTEKECEIMLNYFTDRLWDDICSEEHCKSIVERLLEKYPYDEKQIEEIVRTDYFTAFQDINSERWEEYIAICIQYYLWLRGLSKSPLNSNPYYQEIVWTNTHGNDPTRNAFAFKTDFIRPIIEYIESKFSSAVIVLQEIQRYKMRIERFQIITEDLQALQEKELQDNMSLYLFDRGLNFAKEADTNKGRPDFILMDEEGNHEQLIKGLDIDATPLIIEVKYIKDSNKCNSVIEKGIKQVKNYSSQLGRYEACLLIFTGTNDIYFKADKKIAELQDSIVHVVLINLDKKMSSK